MNLVAYMRADTLVPTGGTPDLRPLIGEWINSNAHSNHIVRAVIAPGDDGELTVRIYGAGMPDPIDWGAMPATPFVVETNYEGVGFTARFDFGDVETSLCSNQKKGVLVIQSYTQFKDGSGRPNYFTREFFHR
jgi:hypothetical protein